MTARPSGGSGRRPSSYVNRVAKIGGVDSAETNPDTLTQVKREVAVMDALEISDNATWVTKVAALPAKYKKMFEVGNFGRLRYRYYVYGWQIAYLSDLLSYLILANYGTSAVTGWLRLAAPGTTTLGSGYNNVVDVLNANPAVQTDDTRRPAASVSANGLPIMTFVDDFLSWPLNASNNQSVALGFAGWLKAADIVTNKTIAITGLTAGGASANKVLYMLNNASYRTDAMTVDRHALTGAVADTGWHFVTYEINCATTPETAQAIITLDTVVQAVSFSSDTAWPVSLGTPTGNMFIGATTLAGASPWVGFMGPNLYALGRQLTAAERTTLFNFERPT